MTGEVPIGEFYGANERDHPVDVARLRNLAELIEDASALISALSTNRIPDASNHTFRYWIPSSGPIALPQIVQDRTITRDLHEVSLTLGTERSEPTYLSLDIVDEDSTLHISRSGTDSGTSEPDWFIDHLGNPSQTRKISKKEVNWLIMSLIRPNKTGDYSQFNGTDFLAPDLYENLTDTLERTATSVSSTGMYILSDGKSELTYSLENKQVQTFSVTFEAAKSGRVITAQVDCQTGVVVNFFALENGNRTILIPDLGDIIHLREIILHEIEMTKPIHIYLGDNDQLPDESLNPEHITLREEERRSDFLNEDGLDSPDPRTA